MRTKTLLESTANCRLRVGLIQRIRENKLWWKQINPTAMEFYESDNERLLAATEGKTNVIKDQCRKCALCEQAISHEGKCDECCYLTRGQCGIILDPLRMEREQEQHCAPTAIDLESSFACPLRRVSLPPHRLRIRAEPHPHRRQQHVVAGPDPHRQEDWRLPGRQRPGRDPAAVPRRRSPGLSSHPFRSMP